MATITGTLGSDILHGTAGDDLISPLGTNVAGEWDRALGGLGSDTYDLGATPKSSLHRFVIRDTGGSADAILGAGALYQSASFGYSAWATFVRQGDNLIIHLPAKPYRFHSPSKPAWDIKIVDHFAPDGQVETIELGGVTYQLAASTMGTALADIITGSNAGETFSAGAGDDFVFANGGRDDVSLGAGNDVAFGGWGRDTISGGDGNDRIYGDNGADRIFGEDGNDWIEGGSGRDILRGGAGNDWLEGGAGNDALYGGSGVDVLTGGEDDDRLVGGGDGDSYRFSLPSGGVGFGHDVIRDRGNSAATHGADVIEIGGLYGPSSGNTFEAFARMSFAHVGDDMVLSIDGGTSSITVQDMFGPAHNKNFIEQLTLNAGYWEPLTLVIRDGAFESLGEDRDNVSPGLKLSSYNEILFGTAGDDAIYGGGSTNFIVTGAGNDVLHYKQTDPIPFYPGGGVAHDIVEDFDIAHDMLDFSEVGTSLAGLSITDGANGAIIGWDSGTWEVAGIVIELRGVAAADVTGDLFLF